MSEGCADIVDIFGAFDPLLGLDSGTGAGAGAALDLTIALESDGCTETVDIIGLLLGLVYDC